MSEEKREALERTQGERFRELRATTGMNRKEFAEYLDIPYRTMQEWEIGRRNMPEYVFALIEYKVRNEFGEKMQMNLSGTKITENPMKGIEDMIEQNDNQVDGVINNLPEKNDLESGKESVLEKIKENASVKKKEKVEALCPDMER